jgi:ribonuclease J
MTPLPPSAAPFDSWTEPPKPGELRLIPIGGLGEFGMNALVVHSEDFLVLVDCGQLFPGDDQPGIDRIVPDFAYLEVFGDELDAVVLTHGHEDHIGAVPYLLSRWPVPVYGTAFTLSLLQGKLKEHDLDPKDHLREVADYARLKVGKGLEVEWIPVTHSIPDACAVALHTAQGVVLHSGDFKIDPTPIDGRLMGLARLKELGDAGVRLLMSDSTNVMVPGPTPSERICVQGLRDALAQTPGRLFVATFSSNIHRLQILVDEAYAAGRKVCLLGRSLERAVAVARERRRFALPDDILIGPADLHMYAPADVVVACTGSQGEPQSGLMRVLRGEVKGLKMGPKDRLVLSSRPIPGNEVAIAHLLDAAARLGAETTLEGLGPVHATGHAHRGDLEELIRTVRPEHMVPVHGTFRNLQAHGKVAAALGWKKERIHLLDGGTCLQLTAKGVRLAGSVPVGRCFVDEGVEHMVDARVVQDRLILQEDGVIFATLLVDPRTMDLVAEPTILSRGFVMLSDDETYGALLKGALRKAMEETPFEIRKDREALRDLLRQSLRRVIRKTTGTRPLVVPVLMDAP